MYLFRFIVTLCNCLPAAHVAVAALAVALTALPCAAGIGAETPRERSALPKSLCGALLEQSYGAIKGWSPSDSQLHQMCVGFLAGPLRASRTAAAPADSCHKFVNGIRVARRRGIKYDQKELPLQTLPQLKEDACGILRDTGRLAAEDRTVSSQSALVQASAQGWWPSQPQFVQTRNKVLSDTKGSENVASWWAGAKQPAKVESSTAAPNPEAPKPISPLKVRLLKNGRNIHRPRRRLDKATILKMRDDILNEARYKEDGFVQQYKMPQGQFAGNAGGFLQHGTKPVFAPAEEIMKQYKLGRVQQQTEGDALIQIMKRDGILGVFSHAATLLSGKFR